MVTRRDTVSVVAVSGSGRPQTGVAVVGTGAFAREHLLALAELPDVQVTHVVGTHLDRAATLAAIARGAVPTTDGDAVLRDPRVDAVDVVTATPDHAPWTIRAGLAGKHVHVEKPAALSLADLDAMVDATVGRGLGLMVGQTVRFQPVVAEVKQALDDGTIGRPRLLHLTWYTGHVWPQGWRSWQLDPALSGGHPVHNGTHAVDAAVWLIGRRPVRVFCRGLRTWAPDTGTPDSFSISLRFDDGSLALLELCYALRQPGAMLRRLVVCGELGTLHHNTSDDPGTVVPGGAPGAPASIQGALDVQLRHWIDTLHGASPVVTVEQVRHALAAALAAQQSLVTGRAVEVEAVGR